MRPSAFIRPHPPPLGHGDPRSPIKFLCVQCSTRASAPPLQSLTATTSLHYPPLNPGTYALPLVPILSFADICPTSSIARRPISSRLPSVQGLSFLLRPSAITVASITSYRSGSNFIRSSRHKIDLFVRFCPSSIRVTRSHSTRYSSTSANGVPSDASAPSHALVIAHYVLRFFASQIASFCVLYTLVTSLCTRFKTRTAFGTSRTFAYIVLLGNFFVPAFYFRYCTSR